MNTVTNRGTWRVSRWTLALVAAIALLAPATAAAIPLTINDPIYIASQSPAPPHQEAGSVAHIFDQSITLASAAYYQAAWDAWNATQPVNAQWTLVDGGNLANLGLTVSTFDADSDHTDNHNPDPGVGGVEIQIDITYNGADRGELVWSQGLYLNYKPGNVPALFPPFYTMDTASFSNLTPGGNIWRDPVYPYQNNDERFYDFPEGWFDGAFFEGDAFLSKVDYNTRTLTIYDGVEYGFHLYVVDVPEPATWAMMLTGLAMVALFVSSQHRKTASLQAEAA